MAENSLASVNMAEISFLEPAGEAAMLPPDSVSWRVFKNPIAMYVGGITATLLELAEPRIRAGVWDNTEFRDKPLRRLKRTGLAAMVTVYGAESVARSLIAQVNRRHAGIRGSTEHGQPYRASDRELMSWVHTTASFGFLQAYHHFVGGLSQEERDCFYREAQNSAQVYGAPDCPASEMACREQFQKMAPKLEATEVNREFLAIMAGTPSLPGAMRPFQGVCIRAAVALIPAELRRQLGLEDGLKLRKWERWIIKLLARLSDRLIIDKSPAVQSCQRLGLPRNFLYKSR